MTDTEYLRQRAKDAITHGDERNVAIEIYADAVSDIWEPEVEALERRVEGLIAQHAVNQEDAALVARALWIAGNGGGTSLFDADERRKLREISERLEAHEPTEYEIVLRRGDDVMQPYDDLGMVGSLHLWSCLNCGTLVVRKSVHNKWHDGQDKSETSQILVTDGRGPAGGNNPWIGGSGGSNSVGVSVGAAMVIPSKATDA